MKLETQQSAGEKIKELRAQVAKDKEAKIKDGKDRKQAGQGPTKEGPSGSADGQAEASRAGGVRWEAPKELREVDFTAQEREFAALVEPAQAEKDT